MNSSVMVRRSLVHRSDIRREYLSHEVLVDDCQVERVCHPCLKDGNIRYYSQANT